MTNLNPKQFFHGTTSKLAPGDVLRPGRDVGLQRHSPSEPDDELEPDVGRVFSTSDEGDAWAFAVNASSYSLYENNREFQDRPYVYEVEPQGNVGGRYESQLPNTPWETTSDTAVVKRRIDIPKPNSVLLNYEETGPAVQGTLPGDEPEFGHGYMGEDEALRLVDSPKMQTFHERDENQWFRDQEKERAFRKTGHPELFNGEEFHDVSRIQDRRHRSRW